MRRSVVLKEFMLGLLTVRAGIHSQVVMSKYEQVRRACVRSNSSFIAVNLCSLCRS
jgi:hypothetical protein